MKLVFFDETSDSKIKQYFGLCFVICDSYSYRVLKDGVQKILIDSGWDPVFEFKGETLFSLSKGDTSVLITDRIKIATDILSLNVSVRHARLDVAYFHKESVKSFPSEYLKYLPILLNKVLTKAPRGPGKNLLSFHYDRYDAVDVDALREAVKSVISRKGYALFEDIIPSNSNSETIGIMYADLIGYLYGRIATISQDAEVFGLSPLQLETDTRYRKLKSSTELIRVIKKLKIYELKNNK